METDGLQNTGKKIFDIEMEIDKARMRFLEDDRCLTNKQRGEKIRQEGLSKMADSISKNYRNLTDKFSEFQLEKLIFNKKAARLQEKAEKLAEAIGKVEKKLAKIEKINENASHSGKILQETRTVRSTLAARRLKFSINEDCS